METEFDGPLLAASLLILAVLIGSIVLWARQIRAADQGAPRASDAGVDPWRIGWVNFGIFLCAMIITVFVAQNLGAALLFRGTSPETRELTPWLAVFAVCLLQLPMIAVFALARGLWPAHYAGRMSSRVMAPLAAAKEALPLFIMWLPLVWAATLIWSGILSILERLGVVGEVQPQELITLFTGGGDPIALGLLVLMAIILAPLVEEIIFRGCIYRFLKSQTPLLTAQCISGAVFALLHANLLSFVPLMLVGVLLARVYEKTGSLLVAIWFHAFFNAFSLGMLFLTSLSDNLPT